MTIIINVAKDGEKVDERVIRNVTRIENSCGTVAITEEHKHSKTLIHLNQLIDVIE